MRRRFRFEMAENEYGVFGEFGPERSFSVVQLMPGAPAANAKTLATLKGIESAEQLKNELEKKFAGLTGLRPF